MTCQGFPAPRSGTAESSIAQVYRSHRAGDKPGSADRVSEL